MSRIKLLASTLALTCTLTSSSALRYARAASTVGVKSK